MAAMDGSTVPYAVGGHPLPTCVIDVRLSLGTGGLYWVLGLARTIPVWLVQTHWAIVEDPFYLSEDPLVRFLACQPDESLETCRAVLQTSCLAWREARSRLLLDNRQHLYWPAERAREANLPKAEAPKPVIGICDALAAGLDGRRRRSPETLDAIADCARDTLALVAALGGLDRVPLVLTRLAAGEAEPMLARCLEEAGIPCPQVSSGLWLQHVERTLGAPVADAGLATALLAGALRLAALQVVAPSVPLAPVEDAEGIGEALDWDAAAHGDDERHWDHAIAVWSELSCGA